LASYLVIDGLCLGWYKVTSDTANENNDDWIIVIYPGLFSTVLTLICHVWRTLC